MGGHPPAALQGRCPIALADDIGNYSAIQIAEELPL
jgi:hypothetical protein